MKKSSTLAPASHTLAGAPRAPRLTRASQSAAQRGTWRVAGRGHYTGDLFDPSFMDKGPCDKPVVAADARSNARPMNPEAIKRLGNRLGLDR